jgi:hypothetical protein
VFIFASLTALALALLAASADPVAATGEAPKNPPAPSDEHQIILSYAPAAGSCAPEATPEIDLSDLLSELDDHFGKCVSTEGYVKARALFFRKSDLRRKYSSSNSASARRRIGLYGGEDLLRAASQLEAQRVRVTGFVYSCADLGEPGDLVLGYCHYSGGPFIGLTSIRGADASD